MGPPPVGPAGPTGPPPPIRPAAGWYALPITMGVLAVVVFFGAFALLWNESEVADGRPVEGPESGVSLRLEEGYGYFVYVRDAAEPDECRVVSGERTIPVRLTDEHSWVASEVDSYAYAATFTAPVTGQAQVACAGTGGWIRVQPDDASLLYLGLSFFLSLGLLIVALVSLPIIMLRRSGARRRAAAVTGPPYGY
ncbi:hypothetical protein BJF79_33390 [Actinomadura sp. CNU-125]|uniref:hypothetical protein n=1 Tax=Actinomadura sp. CNU-125 TaxID=1904961 RepID=UPI00095A431F|nr:hypothetical protein [Actinomadura sp. CNU-125]OLT34500.1 hypothetical protein BJF79_33390 [Actinomadura sp. CNU-125]